MLQKIHLIPKFSDIIVLHGLCVIEGVYHIFFLYSKDTKKRWGHFSTKDFLHYNFSSGEAEGVICKPCNRYFFANTTGEKLMMELIKSPQSKRKCFFSLPKKVVFDGETMLQYPAPQLSELRQYRRNVKLKPGENADTFGGVFEAILTFTEDNYEILLRDDITIRCENNSISVTHQGLCQSFNSEDSKHLHIFSDISSVEIFTGGNVLSVPAFPNEKGTVTVLCGECRAEIYNLKNIEVSFLN